MDKKCQQYRLSTKEFTADEVNALTEFASEGYFDSEKFEHYNWWYGDIKHKTLKEVFEALGITYE